MIRKAASLLLCILLLNSLLPQQTVQANGDDKVLILIPGFMGTTLQDHETGAKVWPNPSQVSRLADTTSSGQAGV